MAKTRENTQKNIIVKGAKLHNLKNISFEFVTARDHADRTN